MIEVSWDITTDAVYKVNIVINASDRPGMMADIMQVTSEAKLNINALNCRTDKHKKRLHHHGAGYKQSGAA